MFGCQQVLINPKPDLAAVLEFICGEANKLHNYAVYYARQLCFKTGRYVTGFDLSTELKSNPHYQALCAQASQQICGSVGESIRSYRSLIKLFKKGQLLDKPQLPKYRTKGGLQLIAYPRQALGKKLVDGKILVPLGQKVQAWFGLKNFELPMPTNLDYASIKELRILPRNGCFYAEFVYKVETTPALVDTSKALGIDPGINNWLTCVTNIGTSFIIDGKHLKSVNRWYNKQVSTLKEGKSQGFWSKKLALITEKRNRQMRDAVNKAAKLVVNYCIKSQIGTVVFGWNKGQKDSANLGGKTNQKFVQIPTAKLKTRIEQLCLQYGLNFIETEESYSSKTSFIDNDFLPKFGAKPEGWKQSGKRIKRGLYRTAQNWYINADANGAANILRKVSTILGLNLSGVSRGALARPQRVKLWSVKQNSCVAVLQTA